MTKIVFIFTLTLLTFSAQADFLDAQTNYELGKFQQAFDEFTTLAKLGNTKAQYNLAVMYLKGKGTKKDLSKAYAWSLFVKNKENPKYEKLTKIVKKSLSQEQLKSAQEQYQKLFENYSDEVIKLKLAPTFVEVREMDSSESKTSNLEQNIETKLIDTTTPKYPLTAARAGIQGWAKFEFDVFPDGSVRNINPIESFPKDVFVQAASKAIGLYKIGFEKDGKKIILTEPKRLSQRIDFRLLSSSRKLKRENNSAYAFNPIIDEHSAKTLIENAMNGDEISQYTIATNYETFFASVAKLDKPLINDWLLKAAQDGVLDAQYKIGQNIFYGKGCKVEKQKGLDWIANAAQLGHKDAEYLTYKLLNSNKLTNNTDKGPTYWLEQAAQNGSLIAQLKYVKHIATIDKPTTKQLSNAESFLKNYGDKVSKNIDWLHTKALYEAKTGKNKKAKKSLQKAIRIAKYNDWDVSDLEKDLSEI